MTESIFAEAGNYVTYYVELFFAGRLSGSISGEPVNQMRPHMKLAALTLPLLATTAFAAEPYQ